MGDPQAIAAQLRTHCRIPLAIVGVGNPLRGDDGFGPAVIAALPPLEGVTTFDVGMAPENWLGPIARAHPRSILVLDCAHLDRPPGTLGVLRSEQLDAVATSTHGLPLGIFLGMLEERCGAPTVVLAVQPRTVRFGEAMSEEVTEAVGVAIEAIAAAVGAPGTGRADTS